MFRVTLAFDLNKDNLAILLEALTRINADYLLRHPSTPQLYQSGVRYRREPPGSERWLSVPAILRTGFGDCEDLACWRAAELRIRGIRAKAFPTLVPSVSGRELWHIKVGVLGGEVEDPSKKLGM